MNSKYYIPLLILASGGLLYFYFKNKDPKVEKNIQEDIQEETSKQSTPKQSTSKSITYYKNKVLKLGTKGIEVRMLQLFLNLGLRQAKKPLLETKSGIFGKKTEEALFSIFKVKEITIKQIETAWKKTGYDWDYLVEQARKELTK